LSVIGLRVRENMGWHRNTRSVKSTIGSASAADRGKACCRSRCHACTRRLLLAVSIVLNNKLSLTTRSSYSISPNWTAEGSTVSIWPVVKPPKLMFNMHVGTHRLHACVLGRSLNTVWHRRLYDNHEIHTPLNSIPTKTQHVEVWHTPTHWRWWWVCRKSRLDQNEEIRHDTLYLNSTIYIVQ